MALPIELLNAISSAWDQLHVELKAATPVEKPLDPKEEPVAITDAAIIAKPSPVPLAMANLRVSYEKLNWKVRAMREDSEGKARYTITIQQR